MSIRGLLFIGVNFAVYFANKLNFLLVLKIYKFFFCINY